MCSVASTVQKEVEYEKAQKRTHSQFRGQKKILRSPIWVARGHCISNKNCTYHYDKYYFKKQDMETEAHMQRSQHRIALRANNL